MHEEIEGTDEYEGQDTRGRRGRSKMMLRLRDYDVNVALEVLYYSR